MDWFAVIVSIFAVTVSFVTLGISAASRWIVRHLYDDVPVPFWVHIIGKLLRMHP